MELSEIERCFSRDEGYYFARWARPVAPIVFGVDDATLSVIKGAVEAVASLGNIQIAETDPELGANLYFFFFSQWQELLDTPGLDRVVPDLAPLVDKLSAQEANQYRLFRFDSDGAIRACFAFIRMDPQMQKLAAEDIALAQVVQAFLLWSNNAFSDRGLLGKIGQNTILRPDITDLIRAAYDSSMPSVANDKSHALRLLARMNKSS